MGKMKRWTMGAAWGALLGGVALLFGLYYAVKWAWGMAGSTSGANTTTAGAPQNTPGGTVPTETQENAAFDALADAWDDVRGAINKGQEWGQQLGDLFGTGNA